MIRSKFPKVAQDNQAGSVRISTFPASKRRNADFQWMKIGNELKIRCDIFSYSRISTEKTTQKFLQELVKVKEGPRYQNLKSLTFTMEEKTLSVSVEILNKLFTFIKQNFRTLEILQLNLQKCESNQDFNGYASDALAVGIGPNLRTLKVLHIQLPRDHYNPYERNPLVHLLEQIGENLKRLQSLRLDASRDTIRGLDESGVAALIYQLENNLRELHTLHLTFQNSSPIPDKAIFKLFKQIRARSRTLKNISLELSNFEDMKEGTMTTFVKKLKPDRNFGNVDLNFLPGMIFTRRPTKLQSKEKHMAFEDNLYLVGSEPKGVIPQFASLSGLYVDFGINYTDNGLIKTFKSFASNIKSLKKLNLILEGYDNKGVMTLAQIIGSNCQGLEQLHLDIIDCKTTDAFIISLSHQIKTNLENLQDLYLNFRDFRDERENNSYSTHSERSSHRHSYQSVIILFNQIFANLTNIQALYVNFQGKLTLSNKLGTLKPVKRDYYSTENDWSFAQAYKENSASRKINISENLPPPNSDLTFEFSCWQTTDNLLLNFFEQIGANLNTLQTLRLDFKEYRRMKSDTLASFSNLLLPFLSAVKDISLNFSMCQGIDSDAVIALSTQIGIHLQSLECIDLNFAGCIQINDEALIALSQQFQNNLLLLKNITLNFAKCEQISSEAIKAFSSCTSKLDTLELIFADCPLISDEAAFALCGMPAHITEALYELERLTSNYTKIKKITEESLDILSDKIISGFSKLQILNNVEKENTIIPEKRFEEMHAGVQSDHLAMQAVHLNLKKYEQNIQQSIVEVVDKIDFKLKEIKNLHLDFRGCKKITNMSLLALREQIAHFKNIRRVYFNFKECEKVSEDFIKDLVKCAHSNCIGMDSFVINNCCYKLYSANCFDYRFAADQERTLPSNPKDQLLSSEEVLEFLETRLQKNMREDSGEEKDSIESMEEEEPEQEDEDLQDISSSDSDSEIQY